MMCWCVSAAHACGAETAHVTQVVPQTLNEHGPAWMAAELRLTAHPLQEARMVWLLERNNDVLTCEIRQTPDSTAFEFDSRPGADRRRPCDSTPRQN